MIWLPPRERERERGGCILNRVDILLDDLSSVESLSLTLLPGRLLFLCVRVQGVQHELRNTIFLLCEAVVWYCVILCPPDFFSKPKNLRNPHACTHTQKHTQNPTITTSYGEHAARLFLDVLLFWKIYPWHKKRQQDKDAAQLLGTQTGALQCSHFPLLS